MEEIRVNLKKTEDKSYNIVIHEGVLKEIPSKLKEAGLGHKFAIITDSTVESLYGTDLSEGFTKNDLENKIISFPPASRIKTETPKPGSKIRCLKINLLETLS